MNAKTNRKSSQVGIELVRLLVSEGFRVFTIEDARNLSARVGLKDTYLWEALHHLRQNGWIISLRRGLYAIAESVPGALAVHEFEVAMALVDPAAISHWSALHYHGLTEQTPQKVFVLTTTKVSIPRLRGAQRSGEYRVGDISYQFIQVKPERYFGTEKVWVGEAQVTVTDPERTLLDGLVTPQYFGDFAEILHGFEVRQPNLNVERIIEYALRMDAAAAKRLGWVLQAQGVEPTRLESLLRLPIKGYRKLDPSGPRSGRYHRRWMIQENLPGRINA
ncbi:MAG: type IV toxin-antitoxin system AbiEi family antitoxin domain-containing protein [Bryobacterales bacterium]|nr:type IV toxin-antitoxin system AbiEi family antitoxin domain-containing protein [Bryobacterales bacterium]